MTYLGVVVPAWNEAKSIGDTLKSLALQEDVSADVVVVANGCTDATAEVARKCIPMLQSGGHTLRVLEIGAASKSAALNAGEAILDEHPRAFIDADVLLTSNALSVVARVLAGPEPRLSAPCLRFNSLHGRSGRIARLLESLPPFSDDVVGGGFYAVNCQGRRRWDLFPPIIADDAFVCSHFRRNERVRATDASFSARFPSDEALLGVLARWRAGRQQLVRLGFHLETNSRSAVLKALISRPHLWTSVAEYAWVRRSAHRRVSRRLEDDNSDWARAD